LSVDALLYIRPVSKRKSAQEGTRAQGRKGARRARALMPMKQNHVNVGRQKRKRAYRLPAAPASLA
jgi:hypothetical protein